MTDLICLGGGLAILVIWVWFYPNPFHRAGRFRNPGWWNGKFGKSFGVVGEGTPMPVKRKEHQ